MGKHQDEATIRGHKRKGENMGEREETIVTEERRKLADPARLRRLACQLVEQSAGTITWAMVAVVLDVCADRIEAAEARLASMCDAADHHSRVINEQMGRIAELEADRDRLATELEETRGQRDGARLVLRTIRETLGAKPHADLGEAVEAMAETLCPPAAAETCKGCGGTQRMTVGHAPDHLDDLPCPDCCTAPKGPAPDIYEIRRRALAAAGVELAVVPSERVTTDGDEMRRLEGEDNADRG